MIFFDTIYIYICNAKKQYWLSRQLQDVLKYCN